MSLSEIYPGKKLLKKGVENKFHVSMTPKYLPMTCLEYQEIDLHTFWKHAYAEAAKQLTRPVGNLGGKTEIKIHREQNKE